MGDKFLFSDRNKLFSSENGINWQVRDLPRYDLTVPVAADGLYLFAGTQGQIYSTRDFLRWFWRTGDKSVLFQDDVEAGRPYNWARFLAGAYGKDTFVFVGEDGVIVQSDPLPRLTAVGQNPPNGSFSFRSSTQLSSDAQIQASTNLIDWIPAPKNGADSITDDSARTNPRRFYRVAFP